MDASTTEINLDELIAQAAESDDVDFIRAVYEYANNPLYTFQPRPDNIAQYDQQASFVNDRFPGIAVVLGGTGSGKSYAGSYKVTKFLMETPAPAPNTPFWIVSQSLEMVTERLWRENLSQFIPPTMIKTIRWYNIATNAAKQVVLEPDANGNNWLIEMMAYDQGRKRLQAANIAGFWCDEQIEYSLLMEIWGRCRKYGFPGSMFYTLTPLEFDQQLEEMYHNREKYPAWKFYRLNTDLNLTLTEEWRQNYLANQLDEMRDTRRIGSFGSYTGIIYKSFNTGIHVIDTGDYWAQPQVPPRGWRKVAGIDFGFSHPTVFLWCAKDTDGRFIIYKEYVQNKTAIEDHVREIKMDWQPEHDTDCGEIYADWAAAQERYQFAKKGLPTAPAFKDVKMGIAKVQSCLRLQEDGKPRLYIDKRCKQLIQEMKSYSWSKVIPDKPQAIDNDCCVVAGTMVETLTGSRPIEDIDAGDYVLTRHGYRRVTAAAQTGVKPVYKMTLTNGMNVTGTAQHPIFTESGFLALQDCEGHDIITLCDQERLAGTDERIICIQRRNRKPIAGIINGQRQMVSSTYTATYGRRHTERYRKAGTSTTRTATRSITSLPIWNASRQKNMLASIERWEVTIPLRRPSIWSEFGHSPQSGTNPPLDESGTRYTVENAGMAARQTSIKNASGAARNSSPFFREPNFAAITAKHAQDTIRAWTTKNAPASNAELSLRETATSKPQLARVSVRLVQACGIVAPVYNLSVEDKNEYFTNGILSHNCDSLRYIIASDRQNDVVIRKSFEQPKRPRDFVKF